MKKPDKTLPDTIGWEIRDVNGVKVLFGKLPVDDVIVLSAALSKILGSTARIDFKIASHYGAAMAIGNPNDLTAERLRLGLPVEKGAFPSKQVNQTGSNSSIMKGTK